MTEKLKIYFDTCCYCRPFDEQSQEKIKTQTLAIFEIFELARKDELIICTSAAVNYEISQIAEPLSRTLVKLYHKKAKLLIELSSVITSRVNEIIALSFKSFDAIHLAFAENENATFITTDERLKKKADKQRKNLIIDVVYPDEFLASLKEGDDE